MGGFKDPDYLQRKSAAMDARKAALEKFRAGTAANNPAAAERQATIAAAFSKWPFAKFPSKAFRRDQTRSKRSRFITLVHAATKSFTNLSFESAHA